MMIALKRAVDLDLGHLFSARMPTVYDCFECGSRTGKHLCRRQMQAASVYCDALLCAGCCEPHANRHRLGLAIFGCQTCRDIARILADRTPERIAQIQLALHGHHG